MDVFTLRNKVVSDYRRYIESFVRIRDSRIDSYVRQEFDSGVLWPESILQLNPAYEPGPTLEELAHPGSHSPGHGKILSQSVSTGLNGSQFQRFAGSQ